MEASVKAVLDQTREVDTALHGDTPTIKGFLIADSKGLCLQAQGLGCSQSAGLLTALAAGANLIEPQSSDPVILIESDKLNYLVKKEDSVTVAIIKHAA